MTEIILGLSWARSKPNSSGGNYPSSMPEKPEFQVEFATSKNIYEDGNPLHPDPESKLTRHFLKCFSL